MAHKAQDFLCCGRIHLLKYPHIFCSIWGTKGGQFFMSEWEEFKRVSEVSNCSTMERCDAFNGPGEKKSSKILENQGVLHEVCHGVALQGPDSPAPHQLQRNNLLRLFLTVHVKYLH